MKAVFINIICCFFCICLFGQTEYIGTPFIETYDISQYNSGPVNRCINQDANGIIYFGNSYGLLKYDGVHWETFSIKSGFSVYSIFLEKERIYIGSQFEFGYFENNELGKLEYYSLSEKLTENYLFSNVVDVMKIDELIYFFSYEYLFIYNSITEELEVEEIKSYGPGIGHLKNSLLFSSYEKGLVSFNRKGEKVLSDNAQLKGSAIKEIIPTSKNRLLIFTLKNGVFELEGGIAKPWESEAGEILKNTQISAVTRAEDGHYLIGTYGIGILKIDSNGKLLSIFNKNNGLRSNTINTLFQDKYGTLWVGHNDGISKIDYDSPFTKIDDDLGLKGFGNVAIKYKNELYLGSSTGLYRYNKAKKYYELIPNSEGSVLSLELFNGRLLVGHDRGLFIYENDELTKISDWLGVWRIMKIPEKDNQLLLGGYKGLEIVQINKNEIRTIPLEGFKEPCRVMEFDERGYLWMTHGHKGIFRLQIDFEEHQIKEIKFYDGAGVFPSSFFINVFKIDNEIIFTGQSGVFQFNYEKNAFEEAPIFSKLFPKSLQIRELEEDHIGNIFYFAETQSGIIKKDDYAFQKLEEPFLQIVDLVNDGIVDYTSVDEYNLLLGANEGFIHFNPHDFNYEADSFDLYIRQIDRLGERDSVIYKVEFGEPTSPEIIIPYQNNGLRFSSSAIYYSHKADIQYSYFIENFDQSWSSWTNKSEKEYIHLPPGKYKFHVKSKNVFQIESNITTINFTILPPWYHTTVAYLFYFLMFIMAIGFWYKRLQNQHSQEKHIIELEKQKEIKEKENEIAEIEESKKQEIVKLRNEKLKAEINHKNKELATSTLHLINKNQLLSTIKQELVKAKDLNEPDELTGKISDLVKKINKSIEKDADWERFQIHFDQVHGDFSKRLSKKYDNLSPQDLKIAAYLRMNLSSKEIAQLLNISLRGVEKARYRLRKKMGLAQGENLTQHILRV